MTLTPGQIKLLVKLCVTLAVLVGVALFVHRCTKRNADFRDVKAVVKAQDKAAKQTAESVQISKDTQRRVETESEDTRQRTQRAVEAVDARIEAEPVGAGPADPDLLRIAREAHQRALCAHSRVQRTSDCANTSAAP